MRLKDKTAIVTGAGSGFGAGIAQRFAEEGAKVIVNDINAQGGERVAKRGRRRSSCRPTSPRAPTGQSWCARRAPSLDIIVNNAGWTHRNKPYLEVTEAEFDRVYAVNVKSIYLSAMHAVPVFRKRGGGCFVNIASTAGMRPRPGLTVYNSSKGAVITDVEVDGGASSARTGSASTASIRCSARRPRYRRSSPAARSARRRRSAFSPPSRWGDSRRRSTSRTPASTSRRTRRHDQRRVHRSRRRALRLAV